MQNFRVSAPTLHPPINPTFLSKRRRRRRRGKGEEGGGEEMQNVNSMSDLGPEMS